MRTLFETSWVKDAWSPNMGLGQAAATGTTPATGTGAGEIFGELVSATKDVLTSRSAAEKADDDRKAAEAKAAADIARTQAAAAAAAAGGQQKILGMSPATAAIVGVAGVAAIIGVVMLAKKK
jgi:hypothetical protein